MIGGMGMKNKNVLFAVLGIIVLVVLVIGVFYHFRDRRTYTLNLPQLEKLESISLNQNEKDISINGREEMKDILYVLNGTKRVTKNESIQDAPINIDDEIETSQFIVNDYETEPLILIIEDNLEEEEE